VVGVRVRIGVGVGVPEWLPVTQLGTSVRVSRLGLR